MSTLLDSNGTTWPVLPLKYGLRNNFVAPNALVQSAIFSTQFYRSHADRPCCTEKMRLTAIGKGEIYQTAGQQLDQGDAEVFYELMRQVFDQGPAGCLEARVRFKRSSLLATLGRTSGGKTRKLLDDSLDRLFCAEYELNIPDVFAGRLRLIQALHPNENQPDTPYDFEVLLDMSVAQLFRNRQWTILKKTERSPLGRDWLAKGLHAYYSTQKSPYPMKPSTLKSLMGRDTMQDSKWRQALQVALEKVKQVTGWPVCELSSQGATAGMVVVEKASSRKVPSAIDAHATNTVSASSYGSSDDFDDDI